MKILNIEKFIQDNKCLEVTNSFAFERGNTGATEDGLYSSRIFGSDKKEIGTTFGYIKLHSMIMHPAVFQMMNKVKTAFTYCLKNEKKYLIVDGMLKETKESEDGKSGIGFLYENWAQIKFDKYLTDRNKHVLNFMKNKKDEIFINKFLVVPKKFRTPTEKNGIPVADELTGLYMKLLTKVNSGKLAQENEFMRNMLKDTSKNNLIQTDVNKIYDYFINMLKAKEGHFRSTLISKRIDNNTRLVANARPDIPVDCCALPWHVLLNVFDAFVIGYLRDTSLSEQYLKDLGIESFNDTALAEHFNYIYQNADAYVQNNPGKREHWVALLKDILEYHPELRVTVKRDPAWSKGSYVAAKPIINPKNEYVCIVNSFVYKPFGGDSFNTDITIEQSNTKILQSSNNITISTVDNNAHFIKSADKILQNIFLS